LNDQKPLFLQKTQTFENNINFDIPKNIRNDISEYIKFDMYIKKDIAKNISIDILTYI